MMADAIETIESGDFTASIYYDDSPESPRDWDNVGRMICWHPRYTIGDDHSYADPGEFWRNLVSDILNTNALARPVALALIRDDRDARDAYMNEYNAGAYADFVTDYIDGASTDVMTCALDSMVGAGLVLLPIYAYEHGAITISTGGFSDPWDSGQVGYIYCTQADVDREWNGDHDKARAYLEGEVETMAQYLGGGVYGYVVTDADGNGLDSCWGFYGLDYVREEAQSIMDHYTADAGMYQGAGI